MGKLLKTHGQKSMKKRLLYFAASTLGVYMLKQFGPSLVRYLRVKKFK